MGEASARGAVCQSKGGVKMLASQHDKFFARSILLLQELSEHGEKKIGELAEMFGVSTRTIYRDIERLHFFPIELEKGEGLVRIAEGFTLQNPKLQDYEMLVVELAFSSLRNMGEEIEKHLNSIRAKITNPLFFSPYDIKAETFQKIDIDSELMNKIEDAIVKRNVSTVTSNAKTATVEPYKVVAFDGIWYLLAKDLDDSKIKTYLIADIEEFRATTEVFSQNYVDVDKLLENVHTAWFEDGNSFEVRVKVYKEIAHFFELKKHLTSQKIIRKYSDGSLLLSFEVSHDEDVDNLIKAWLPHIEIISPKRLREKLQSELEGYLINLKANSIQIDK